MRNNLTRAIVMAAVALGAAPRAARAAGDETYKQLKLLVDVLGYIQDNYVDETPPKKLIYGAASGMVRTLDPFSQFLDEEGLQEIKTETEGEFGGIGIRVLIKDDWLTVLTPLPGTPAYRAGILPDDRIAEIDGESTRDMSMTDVLKKLHGAPGTPVKLSMLRGDEEDEGDEDKPWASRDVTLTREIIRIESVEHWKLGGDLGYIRINEFSARTAEEVEDAMKDLGKQGAQSLILDLRNNPGGLLSGAVEVASFFVGEGKLIVYTQGRKPDSRQDFRSTAQAPYADVPLVVLVNEGSASGSEIVAGALQDHRRAVVMGTRTYGKASVQSVIPLTEDTGLRLTVARYYTPLGRSIARDEKHKTGGITPDVVIPIAHSVEAKLYAQWDMIYGKDRKPKSAVKREDMVPDEALERAESLLEPGAG